jgi:N utilization substance protein B
MTTRHAAREAALQILYFWEVGRTTPDEAIDAYFAEHQPDAAPAARAFAAALVQGTVAHVAALDQLIARHSTHWRLDRLATVDRLILRMAVWELQHAPDTPPAVAIDEAVELARTFSGEEAAKFVNGVLDAIHRDMA